MNLEELIQFVQDWVKKFQDHRHTGIDSQKLVVTDLGIVPASGVVTSDGTTFSSETPLTVAKGGTGLATITAHNLPVGNGTGVTNLIAPSAAGGFLVSQGASADPAFDLVPFTLFKVHHSTSFENIGRFEIAATGDGVNPTTDGSGGRLNPSNTGSAGSAKLNFIVQNGANGAIFTPPGVFTAEFTFTNIGTTGSAYIGIGTVTVGTTGHTFTDAHIGFKVLISSSVATLYATVGSSGGETASAAMTTLTTSDCLSLLLIIQGNNRVDFYYRMNSGAISPLTTLTRAIPQTASVRLQASLATDNVASISRLVISAMDYLI